MFPHLKGIKKDAFHLMDAIMRTGAKMMACFGKFAKDLSAAFYIFSNGKKK